MADQFNEFDQIFRDRLRDQSVVPPDSVWNNIQAERSFGHIITNKISSSWRIIGTLLLLAMAGGTSALLISNEENNTTEEIQLFSQNETNTPQSDEVISIDQENPLVLNSGQNFDDHLISLKDETIVESTPIEEYNIESDLLASTSNSGFARPNFGDSRLAILIEEMDGWGTAKPASATRFYHLNDLEKKRMEEAIVVQSPLIPEGRWDYVIEPVKENRFRDRTSINFYVGPQFINKILTAKYNMDTDFLEKRLETENTRLAYTAGANLQYELKNNKFIEVGLQFTQIYEEVRIEGDKRFSNQYDFLEIPVLIGFQDRESKWGWSVKGGLGVQIYNNYKGFILKHVESRIASPNPEPEASEIEAGAEYRISGSNVVKNFVNDNHSLHAKQDRDEVYDLSSDENPYKKNGIINVHLAAGVTYYHSINTSFSVTPYYRQSVNTLTKESADFNERISYMGILFGTQVKF